MKKFILLIKGGSPDKSNMEESRAKWMAWMDKVKKDGKWVEGYPFMEKGKEIAGSEKKVLGFTSDVGGYVVVNAGDIDEAIELAKQLPSLDRGGKVSVHEIQDM